jgi:hypothetical protein
VSSPLPKLRTLLYRYKAVLATPLDNKFIGEHNPPLSMLLSSVAPSIDPQPESPASGASLQYLRCGQFREIVLPKLGWLAGAHVPAFTLSELDAPNLPGDRFW